MIAVVHTLTLGWISSSLIGILYVAGARWGLHANRFDVGILVAWGAGASGLVSHFWIEEFEGMEWSAGLAAVAVLMAAARFGMAFAATTLPAGIKLQLNLAWFNLVGAAFIGILIGFNETSPVLPGYSLHNVFAHAHLAALGWAFLQAVALGHLFLVTRRRPLPAAAVNVAGTALTQLGAAGIFVSLLVDEPYVSVFAIILLAGGVLCLAGLLVHARTARLAAAPGASVLLVSIAASIGLDRLGGQQDAGDPAWIMAYGVAGLVAGLGQTVCGLSLLWLCPRGRTWPAVGGWAIASPMLVIGLGGTRTAPITVGAGILLLALAWTARSIWSAASREA